MEETRLFTPDEARQVRRSVAVIGTKALVLLKEELEQNRRGGVTECWAKKFKIVADQLRRDYRLDGDEATEPALPAAPADPLGSLRVVAEDEEVA